MASRIASGAPGLRVPTPGTSSLIADPIVDGTRWPIQICLLGGFRVLKFGQPVPIQSGGKTEILLRTLALRPGYRAPRDGLLATLWPERSPLAACQSLHSLIYALRRQLRDALNGAVPVVHVGGAYRLNIEAGVCVDLALFDALADIGDVRLQGHDVGAAVEHYGEAIALYRGDLDCGTDVEFVIERERLRVRYLTVLAQLADLRYAKGTYAAALQHALRLLADEPCREDAHRMVMRCYVRLGQRAQALRHYRLCEQVLRTEFEAVPEDETRALFDQIRLQPSQV